jgi:hypothetical protein
MQVVFGCDAQHVLAPLRVDAIVDCKRPGVGGGNRYDGGGHVGPIAIGTSGQVQAPTIARKLWLGQADVDEDR